MEKTILVTGGAGFIGSNFVRYMHRKYPNYRLIVLDALTYAGSIENLPIDHKRTSDLQNGRLSFWYGNVRNAAVVESLVAQSDVVVHMAAETHVTRSIFDNFHFFETDVLGTQVVANAVLEHRDRIKLFIHISSSEVYGTALTPKMSEDHPLHPLSPYAAAKAGADRLVYSYWATYKLPTVIVRPFNNYGPYQHLEKAIPRFITSCLLDEPLRVHGDGSAQRDWLFVEDLARALDMLIHEDPTKVVGQTVNLGTERSIDIATIAQMIVRMMGKSEKLIQYIGNRPGQVFRHTASIEKIKTLIGWQPTVSFEQGLARTIEWYKSNRAWWQKHLYMRDVPIITESGKRELH